MPGELTCTVVSPERTLFEGTADHVVAPGWNGQLGIYRRHAPMLARLGVGLVRIHEDDVVVDAFAVRGGFLEVLEDDLRLLVTEAKRLDDIDPAAIPAHMDEVRERLASPGGDFEELLTERRWLQTQLALGEFLRESAGPNQAMAAASRAAQESMAARKTHT